MLFKSCVAMCKRERQNSCLQILFIVGGRFNSFSRGPCELRLRFDWVQKSFLHMSFIIDSISIAFILAKEELFILNQICGLTPVEWAAAQSLFIIQMTFLWIAIKLKAYMKAELNCQKYSSHFAMVILLRKITKSNSAGWDFTHSHNNQVEDESLEDRLKYSVV